LWAVAAANGDALKQPITPQFVQLLINPVGVEKLFLAKFAKMKLRQDAL